MICTLVKIRTDPSEPMGSGWSTAFGCTNNMDDKPATPSDTGKVYRARMQLTAIYRITEAKHRKWDEML